MNKFWKASGIRWTAMVAAAAAGVACGGQGATTPSPAGTNDAAVVADGTVTDSLGQVDGEPSADAPTGWDGVGDASTDSDADAVPQEVAPVDQAAPTLAFKNVFNGTKVSATFAVEVDAQDDVAVVAVEYRLNGTLVQTEKSAPFTWEWDTTKFASGNWYLAAVAKDAAGKLSEVAEVEVTVANKAADCGEAPQVKLVYPTDKAVVCGDLEVQTAASGPCGVAKVEFFVDDKKIGEASEPPYKTPWKTQSYKDGQHFVKAVATDTAKQSSQQTILVKIDNKQSQCVNPPTVFLTKPADNSYVFGKIAIEAEASAGGDVAAIVEVLFSVDGSSIGKAGMSPWATTWDTDAKTEGPHTLKAIAKDNFDKLGVHQITVTVDRTDPTAQFVAPASYANVNGDDTPVTVVADAADNLALAGVSFSAQSDTGGQVSLGSVKQKPWQVQWSTASSQSGTWTLTAKAVDAAGHTGTTTRTVVLDRNPTVKWDNVWDPAQPQSGKVGIAGTASDDLGWSGEVGLTIDGQPVAAQASSGKFKNFSYEWDTTAATFGEHELAAAVEDDGGHKAKITLKVQVDQPLAVDVQTCDAQWQLCKAPPADPAKEQTGKLYLVGTAKDDNANLQKMELQIDGITVQTVAAAPWQAVWDSATVADGVHEVAVKFATSLPQTKTVAFGLTVNNCDLDHDKHLATGGACGGDDCNDADAKTFAGAADLVGNTTDENCDGLDGVDADGDKVASLASGGKDCNDLDKTVQPGATDTAGDGKDQNCDGVDGVDADGDGYASVATGGKDCEDSNSGIHPGAVDFAGVTCAKTSVKAAAPLSSAVDVGSFAAVTVSKSGAVATAYYMGSAAASNPDVSVPTHSLGFAMESNSGWTMGSADPTFGVGQHVSLAVSSTPADNMYAAAYYDATNYRIKVAIGFAGTFLYTQSPDSQKLVGQYTSIAFGEAGGKLHVAYYDYGNYRLKYAVSTGSSWVNEYVDPATNVGEYASLKVGPDGKVHIAYYDAGKKALKVASGNFGAWTVQTVDSAGDPGRYASLVLDSKGKRHIAYYAAATKDLRYASDASGAWVAETALSAGSVGKYAAIGLSSSGFSPVIAYLDEGMGQTMLAWRGGGWSSQAVDANVAAGATSLAVKPDGSVVVAYYDGGAGQLRVATVGCAGLSAGGVDENCDGIDGVDNDGDKVASTLSGGKDCDDSKKSVYPCADELAGDVTDTNCDGKLAPSCDDCQACSQDSLTGGKCLHTAIAEGAVCDDASACTTGEVCKAGVCAGAAKSCDDGNVCTADSCDPALGCGHAVLTDGAACDLDGSKCTPDSCTAGACKASAPVNCDDKNPCTTDSCDAGTGVCSHAKLAEGAACNDSDACTLSDACAAGACKGVAKVCGATEVCVAGLCKAAAPDGMVLIPAGPFKMGCVPGDVDCYSAESPQHTVTLDAFYMDVYEVTAAKYKACVDAGKCTAPDSSGSCSANQYGTFGAVGKEQNPVSCVNWNQADAYCKWTDAKGRLPTEAEWEKAARGGLDDKVYPWGDQLTCSEAVWSGGSGSGCDGSTTMPVGSRPAGKNGYGLYDMSGNVWEWVSDWYGGGYYASSPASNPQGAASGSTRVERGGGFGNFSPANLRASRRGDVFPSGDYVDLGFRCSRSFP